MIYKLRQEYWQMRLAKDRYIWTMKALGFPEEDSMLILDSLVEEGLSRSTFDLEIAIAEIEAAAARCYFPIKRLNP